jgi:CDP-glycerol glycerophosphotransferase (TagB/SpsB family)
MILKLKQVLSSVGVNIDYINNLFYNIDYITYICIGHGVSYFKYYLYDNYYGPNNFNKLLIPNSEKLFNVPIKYGWKYENLIRFNLPRWEKYNFLKESMNEEQKIKSNSIFIMFTFRELKAGKEISNDYINNIVDLLNNEQLINNLANKNITLYFSLHHSVMSLKEKFKFGRNIKYIYENDISECLSKINLLITDYSSIIFDVIYRKKPYIIYIPDANDSKINENYREVCYNLIKNFTNNDFGFENVFFELNSTLEKINYYIDNEFRLDNRLVKFYKEFNFPQGCFMDDFIGSLLKL